jgi:hypothetical protein
LIISIHNIIKNKNDELPNLKEGVNNKPVCNAYINQNIISNNHSNLAINNIFSILLTDTLFNINNIIATIANILIDTFVYIPDRNYYYLVD